MNEANKVWFITGISRGLGRAIAEEALSRGDYVIGTSRSGRVEVQMDEASGRLHILTLDVAFPEDVIKVVAEAQQIYGRLDVIVNNAGYGLLGAVEEASMAELHQQFDVNFFGTLYVTRAVLPYLRQQRSGHIMNCSSVAGLAPKAGYGLYAASKFAVEGLSQSLRLELKPLNIKVTAIEPGAFRTDFLDDSSVQLAQKVITDYDNSSGEFVRFLQKLSGHQPGDPQLAAKVIVDTAYSSDPPLHLLLGSDAYERTRNMLSEFSSELEKWSDATHSTDYAEVTRK